MTKSKSETLFLDETSRAQQETHIVFGILETREQSNPSVAQQVAELELERLRQVPSISFVGLTG